MPSKTTELDVVMAMTAEVLVEARRAYPIEDYSARVYWCPGCEYYDGAVGPRVELVDAYPCPNCGAASCPVVPVAP